MPSKLQEINGSVIDVERIAKITAITLGDDGIHALPISRRRSSS